jgi:hypothetical protein
MLNKSKTNSTINEDIRNESVIHDDVHVGGVVGNTKDSGMTHLNSTAEKKKEDNNNILKGISGLSLDFNKR